MNGAYLIDNLTNNVGYLFNFYLNIKTVKLVSLKLTNNVIYSIPTQI